MGATGKFFNKCEETNRQDLLQILENGIRLNSHILFYKLFLKTIFMKMNIFKFSKDSVIRI